MKPVAPITYKLTEFVLTPIAKQFLESTAIKKFVVGPFGSGKSSMCVYDIFLTAFTQPPANDNVRYTRFAVVRGTYSDLVSSSMKTWVQWIPEYVGNETTQQPFCPITRPMNGSPTGKMHRPWVNLWTGEADGTYVDMEVVFISCDDPRDIGKLRSTDFTKVWWNEISMFKDKRTFDEATARAGRFPSGRFGKCARKGVIGDTNPCDTKHWYYKLAEEEKPEGWEFYRQPPAVIEDKGDTSEVWKAKGIRTVVRTFGKDVYTYRINPECENLAVFGEDYWLEMVKGKSLSWIRVYLMNQYGSIESDSLVFPGYGDDRHCAKTDIAPIPGIPIIIGFDFGNTPAIVISQYTSLGQLRFIEEITTGYPGANYEPKIYLRPFIQRLVKPLLVNKYGGYKIIAIPDPIGGSQHSQTDGNTCFQILDDEHIAYELVPDYGFETRWDAVNRFLSNSVDKGDPALLISPKCKILREAFINGYVYPKMSVANPTEKPRPEKNTIYSHVMDAAEGVCLYVQDNSSSMRSKSRPFSTREENDFSKDRDYMAIV